MQKLNPALALVLTLLIGCSTVPQVPAEDRLDAYSHEPYAEVLEASVIDGNVDYAAITPELEAKLDVYLNAVARFGPEQTPDQFANRDAELAYYLNAYNAIMIKLWLDKGAREADRDDKVQWLTWFTVPQWRVDGNTMNLDHLEQRLIRPRYDEPRIHAALVCGAVDCPPLLNEPYAGETLEKQLGDQTSAWLTDPSEDGLQIRENGKVYLSAIFGWYRDDFREHGGLDAMLSRYLPDEDPRKERAVEAAKNNELNFMSYDWSINLPQE
jgi:hypothetical protein